MRERENYSPSTCLSRFLFLFLSLSSLSLHPLVCVKTQTGRVLTAAGFLFSGSSFFFRGKRSYGGGHLFFQKKVACFFEGWGGSSYGGEHFPSDSEQLFHPHLLVPDLVCGFGVCFWG